MKRIIIGIMLIVMSVSVFAQTNSLTENSEKNAKYYNILKNTRADLRSNLLELLFTDDSLRLEICPDFSRPEIADELYKINKKSRSRVTNFSSQDSLIAIMIGVDLNSKNAPIRIQATKLVFNQIAEQKAAEEVNLMLRSFLDEIWRESDISEMENWDNIIMNIHNNRHQHD